MSVPLPVSLQSFSFHSLPFYFFPFPEFPGETDILQSDWSIVEVEHTIWTHSACTMRTDWLMSLCRVKVKAIFSRSKKLNIEIDKTYNTKWNIHYETVSNV